MIDFWKEMTPILAANILTVCFVYSIMLWSKAEKAGREPQTMAIGFFVLICSFLVYGLYLHGALDAFA